MEPEVHPTIWFQIGKSSFYFWNQFRILVYFNLHKSPPWKLKSPLNLVNHKIAPITHKIAPGGRFRPHWMPPILIKDLMNLLKQHEKLGSFISSLCICRTKAMTVSVEYITGCLYQATTFHSVLIVPSASSLKVKSSHFRKCCEKNFICDHLRKSCVTVE